MPQLPEPLRGLRELAYNLSWSWHPEAAELFQEIDPALWKRFRGNPVKLLLEADPARLEGLAATSYPARVQAVLKVLRDYLKAREAKRGPLVAYFSAEYGFHSALPIYAGGLGVLAGDHVKAASDLGLNLVGVGIFYHEGYFHQRLSPEGAQVEVYEALRPEELPLLPVRDGEGRPLRVAVEFPGRLVWLSAYRVQVGAVPVFLLTADLPENAPEDRAITARLYAPGPEIRIQQEMVLGIGGVRLLRALGLSPEVFHMNEGHSAFLGLERVREMVAEGHSFPVALELARAASPQRLETLARERLGMAEPSRRTAVVVVPAGEDTGPQAPPSPPGWPDTLERMVAVMGRWLGLWPDRAEAGQLWRR